jgi:hypothetical protein
LISIDIDGKKTMLINFFFVNRQTKKILYSFNDTNQVFDRTLASKINDLCTHGTYINNFSIDGKIYCTLQDIKYIYFAHVDNNYPLELIYDRESNNTFFGELQKYITTYYEYDTNANSYQNNIFFTKLYDKYKNPITKIKMLSGQVEDIKKIAVDNVNKIMERGEKIEVLVDSSQALLDQSHRFQKQSMVLKRTICCQSYKMTALVFFVVLVVLSIMALLLYFNFRK